VIAHIVLFEPKPDISADQRAAFLGALREAVSGIAEVESARIGRPVTFGVMPEINGSQTTYTYAAVLEFADQPALQRYLQHPKHDGLRRIFWESCQSTLITDVELSDIDSFIA
jgi:hypothetical protein